MIGRTLLLGLAFLGASSPLGADAAVMPTLQVAGVADTTFRHAKHGEVACMECHGMQSRHGAALVRDVSDCRSCHHTEERVDDDCATCHLVSDMKEQVFTVERRFVLTVGDEPRDREIRFKHVDHEERDCAECHAEGPTRAVPDLDCQQCHEEHHEPTVPGCVNCHQELPDDAHPVAVHESCSGSGCHEQSPVQSAPRSRAGCLWCHEEKTDHEPEGNCATCHFLPTALAAGGAA